jgi:hypothetical protein
VPKDNNFPKHPYHRYQSYLLRLWQERPNMLWRASLQDATTNERMAFLDLESLFAYLRQRASTEADEAGPSRAGDSEDD